MSYLFLCKLNCILVISGICQLFPDCGDRLLKPLYFFLPSPLILSDTFQLILKLFSLSFLQRPHGASLHNVLMHQVYHSQASRSHLPVSRSNRSSFWPQSSSPRARPLFRATRVQWPWQEQSVSLRHQEVRLYFFRSITGALRACSFW